jgi:hypothetical protein
MSPKRRLAMQSGGNRLAENQPAKSDYGNNLILIARAFVAMNQLRFLCVKLIYPVGENPAITN